MYIVYIDISNLQYLNHSNKNHIHFAKRCTYCVDPAFICTNL